MTTAVVVGGQSGIGAAALEGHRERGDDVLSWDVHDGADICCDISNPEHVDAAVAETLGRIGPPDVVTITAGVGHSGLLLDASPRDWDRIVGVNAKGVWLAMRTLARPMLDDGGGSIVVTTSVSAHLADRTMGLYCASKAALDMLVAVAALEWAPSLRVNAVAPGVTDTAMLGPAPRERGWLPGVARRTPLGRLGQAADVAQVILALHDLAWITGQSVTCDGGLSRLSPIDPVGSTSRA